MLVKVLSFGSNWWSRFGRESEDPYRFTHHAAYYNSTGICCGSKIRRHWLIPGLIRFNGIGDFNAKLPQLSIGKTFCCSDLVFAFGGNRLLFERKAPWPAVPDYHLVAITSAQHGPITFRSKRWKSPSACAIAASQLRLVEETMLLLKPGDWVKTDWGFWQLRVFGSMQHGRLELVPSPVLALSD